MITKQNQYRLASGGGLSINGYSRYSAPIDFTPNFKTYHKKIYYEWYIYHNDSSKDHWVESRLISNEGIVFMMVNEQYTSGGSILSSSGIRLRFNENSYDYRYTVPRHPTYGVAVDFSTGKMDIYNGTNSIIASVAGTPIDLDTLTNVRFYICRNDGGNSTVNLTFYFGETGFNYGLPEGYYPACEVLSCAPTYEKENEMYIG